MPPTNHSMLQTSAVRSLLLLGSQWTQELVLFLDGLESSVTILGRGIDELEVDWFQVGSLGNSDQALSQGNWALLGASDSTLDHEPIFVNLAVVREATNRGNSFLGKIRFGRTGVLVSLLADTQDTLVDLSAVEVTLLTSTGNSEADTGRMPCTDTGDLAETSVGLARKSSNTPSADNTVVSVTLGGGTDIQSFTFSEDGVNVNFLFEKALGEIDLGINVTTVNLNFQQVSNLGAKLELSDLGVGKNTDNLSELLDAVQFVLDVLWLLGGLLGVLGESLPLGSVPVLVESALKFVGKVSGPDGGQSAKTIRSGDVTNNTDHNHWRSFQNGNSFNGFLLV